MHLAADVKHACLRRLLLNLSKAMLELSLLTRDFFVKWQHDNESTQVKVRVVL